MQFAMQCLLQFLLQFVLYRRPARNRAAFVPAASKFEVCYIPLLMQSLLHVLQSFLSFTLLNMGLVRPS